MLKHHRPWKENLHNEYMGCRFRKFKTFWDSRNLPTKGNGCLVSSCLQLSLDCSLIVAAGLSNVSIHREITFCNDSKSGEQY